jgi:hypothetical protein
MCLCTHATPYLCLGSAGAAPTAGPTAATQPGREDAGDEEGAPETFTSEVQLDSGSKILFKEPSKLFIKPLGVCPAQPL